MATGNGNGWRTWALSVAVALVLGFGGYAWHSLDLRDAANDEAHAAAIAQLRERLAAGETRTGEILRRLERIETKLDALAPPWGRR